MTLDEAAALIDAARKIHGGKVQLVMRDLGSTDPLAVCRLESVQATTAIIFDLGNGGAAWTLDDERPGTVVPVILLD